MSTPHVSQNNSRLGLDIPICLNVLSRIVCWRDHQVAQWTSDVSQLKRFFNRAATTLCLAILSACAVIEYVIRIILSFCFYPLQAFGKTQAFANRLSDSCLTNSNALFFTFKAIKLNFTEAQIGYHITGPRLIITYLEFYKHYA